MRRFPMTPLLGLILAFLLGAVVRAGSPHDRADRELLPRLADLGITPLDPGPEPPDAQVRLGQALYFDKILSGNRDIACATCHHPSLLTGDELSLSIGTKGEGLGTDRVKDDSRPFVPRNAPEVFNRGAPEWMTMFWDSRILALPTGRLQTPAGDRLPLSLQNVLAAQAMFPVTGRDEMRGVVGDEGNELCEFDDTDLEGIWQALMVRLLDIPEYVALFDTAYPDVPTTALGFEHAANAIGAFEAKAFTLLDSPWDRYLAGDYSALSPQAKRGALLFYGKAGCATCHQGNLLTDQRHHNIAVPQLGPGKAPFQPFDFGRGAVTQSRRDRFAFRTPPLRNVAVTGPWMHNGAYTTLEGAVLHHLDPARALIRYDKSQLDPELQPTVRDDPQTIRALLETLDPLTYQHPPLKRNELHELLAFLDALTSPSVWSLEDVIPDTVPSGLEVDR